MSSVPDPIQPEPSQLWVDGGEVTWLSVFFFQTIMEQFNPSLRNFIAMGKNYEKALAGITGSSSQMSFLPAS